MRKLIVVLALLAAPAAFADEKPDYSRETLLRITRDIVVAPKKTVSFSTIGEVEVHTPVVNIHIPYTLVPPLQGSVPRVTMEWPNPFAQTQMALPMTAQQWSRH